MFYFAQYVIKMKLYRLQYKLEKYVLTIPEGGGASVSKECTSSIASVSSIWKKKVVIDKNHVALLALSLRKM